MAKTNSGKVRFNNNKFKDRDVSDSFQLKLGNRFQPLPAFRRDLEEDRGQTSVEKKIGWS